MRPILPLKDCGEDGAMGVEAKTAESRAYTNLASRVISVCWRRASRSAAPLAPAAAVSNTSLVAPGTLAVVVRAILVIEKPSPTLARVTAAWVSILVG